MMMMRSIFSLKILEIINIQEESNNLPILIKSFLKNTKKTK